MTAAPLRHPGYRLLWSANTASLTGEFMQLVVLSGAALDLSGRASAWGGVLVAQAVPQALLMLAGGVAVDRYRPRRVLVAANLLILAAVLWLGTRPQLTMGELYAFAAVFGACYAFVLPASNAIVPEVVSAGEEQGANALLTVGTTVAQFAGPALAALFLGVGRHAAFAAMALLWLVSILLLLRLPAASAMPAAGSGWSQLVAGFRALRADRVISTLTLAAALFACGYAGGVYVGLPALAKLSFGAGDGGVGVLYGANGIGMLLGALCAGAVTAAGHPGVVGGLAITGAGVLLAVSAAAGSLLAAVPPLVGSGLCWSVGLVVSLTAVQTRSPAELRGRVVSLLTLGFFGLYPLSYGLAGLAGDALGPRGVILCGGGLMAAAGALALGRRAVREVVL